MAKSYYPEFLGFLFIVNAPLVFQGVWSVAKNLMPEKTRKRIKIFGKDFHKALFEVCPPESIPTILGGTCECPGGCCRSNAGPWQDYEFTPPLGIRLKGSEPLPTEVHVEAAGFNEMQS